MGDVAESPGRRTRRLELVGWSAVALLLIVFAVPWFLWRDSTVVAGLPLWLWWHIGWMLLASVVFYVFTQRGWGVGVLVNEVNEGSEDERSESSGVLPSEARQGSSENESGNADEVNHRG